MDESELNARSPVCATVAPAGTAATLLTIEDEGDIAAAKEFLDKYTYVAPDLQGLLDQANATVPVEFVPTYATE